MTEFPGQSIVEIPLSYCSQNTHGQQGTYENKLSQVMTNKTIFDLQIYPQVNMGWLTTKQPIMHIKNNDFKSRSSFCC